MAIDQKDFFLDLLFYHRKLRRLVAAEVLREIPTPTIGT